jgi:hypothetical protein
MAAAATDLDTGLRLVREEILEQTTVLVIPGTAEPFEHTARNTLRKVDGPTPNPTVHAVAARR